MQAFKEDYGAFFCPAREKRLQHWIELIKIQSKRVVLVNITLEKQTLSPTGHTSNTTLHAYSFTKLLDAQLSPFEEFLCHIEQIIDGIHLSAPDKMPGRSKPKSRSPPKNPPPKAYSFKHRLKKLQIELGNFNFLLSPTSSHKTSNQASKHSVHWSDGAFSLPEIGRLYFEGDGACSPLL